MSALPVLLLAWLWLSLVMGVVVGRWLRTRNHLGIEANTP